MGMFNLVNFEMECPNCKSTVGGFQTKDGEVYLATVEPDSVSNFYSSCDQCKTWIEFTKPRIQVPKRKVPLSKDEVEEIAFVMTARKEK